MDDEPKAKSLLAALRGAIDRHVKQRPRDTMVRNAIDDPAEPLAQRVTEHDACDFCNQFANGEPVNPRKVSEKFHAYCKCHFILFFQETRYRETFVDDDSLSRIGITMEEGATPDYYEKRDGLVLAALGRKVEYLKRHLSGTRRADTLIDGELVEFKNPTSNGLFTVQNQILGNLYGGNKSVMKPQSDVLLISNVRNSMTMADMERSLAAAFDERSVLTAEEKAYMRKIILLDEHTRRVRIYEIKEADVARLNGPRRRQMNNSIGTKGNQGLRGTAIGGGDNKPPNISVKKTGGGNPDWRKRKEEIEKKEKPIQKELNAQWIIYQNTKTDSVYDEAVRKTILGYFSGYEDLVFVETGAKVLAKEISTAQLLVQKGHHVRFRAPVYGYKKSNPDFFIDKKYISDFKRIESENENKVFNHIKHAVVDQGAECVVVDLSFESISLEDAVRMAERAYKNPSIPVKQIVVLYGEKIEVIIP